MKLFEKTRAALAAAVLALMAPAALLADTAAAAPAAPKLDTGDTAWVMISTAMVLLMTPALAFFYGGMVRKKNVLSTMMQSMFLMALVAVQWVIFGYSLSFGGEGKFIGDFSFAWLNGVANDTGAPLAATIPHSIFMMFQATFAIITMALISGAIADRFKFSAYVLFALLWTTLVYDPICHMVWSPKGYFFEKGALDFAGGTVVHIISGVSALTLAFLVGKRKGHSDENMLPHNMTYVLLGTGLLWFGWFGFNAGSALGANAIAATAFVNTNTAAAAAALMWCIIDWARNGKPSALGFASGAVAGLVAITPAAGFVTVKSAIVMGMGVSVVCYIFVLAKDKLGYDDSLDAFGIHGVGGTFGALALGFLADPKVNSVVTNTGWNLFKIQFHAVAVSWGLAIVGTIVIYTLVKFIFGGARVSKRDEELGLDLTQHSEAGYEI